MDTFEGKMKELVLVNRMERWRLYDYEKGGCLCKTCPSYTMCAQGNGESLFCLMGMSFRGRLLCFICLAIQHLHL